MLKRLPENWLEVEPPIPLEATIRGSRTSAAVRQKKRSLNVPPDSILEEEALYLKLRHEARLWNSQEKTIFLLKHARDKKENLSSIAKKMNQEFNTKRFTRSSIASRLRFLRNLMFTIDNPWRFSAPKPTMPSLSPKRPTEGEKAQ